MLATLLRVDENVAKAGIERYPAPVSPSDPTRKNNPQLRTIECEGTTRERAALLAEKGPAVLLVLGRHASQFRRVKNYFAQMPEASRETAAWARARRRRPGNGLSTVTGLSSTS